MEKKLGGPWTGSMGWSMHQVHGVVHGPWSMSSIRPSTCAWCYDVNCSGQVERYMFLLLEAPNMYPASFEG